MKGGISVDAKLEKIREYYEKSCIYGKIYEDRYDAVCKLKDYIDSNEFYDIYVKNIGGTELDDEIYLFSKSIILELSFQLKANGVFADYKVYRTSEIINVRLIDDISYSKDVVLDIDFKNGAGISIDNRESSGYIEEEFAQKRKEVNKLILESIFKDMIKIMG